MLTGKLVASKAEGIAHNLLVNTTLDLEEDLVDGHSRSPVVKRAFTLAHTHLIGELAPAAWRACCTTYFITADIDTNVAALALV